MFVSKKRYLEILSDIDKLKKEAMELRKDIITKNIEMNGLIITNKELNNLNDDLNTKLLLHKDKVEELERSSYLLSKEYEKRVQELNNLSKEHDKRIQELNTYKKLLIERDDEIKNLKDTNRTLVDKVTLATIVKQQLSELVVKKNKDGSRKIEKGKVVVYQYVDGVKCYNVLRLLG